MLIFLFHCLFLPYVPRFFFSCLKKFSLSFSKSPFSTKLLVFLRENVISPFYLRIVPLDIKLEVDRSFLLTLEDIPGYMSGNARCGWSSVGGKTPSTWCCSRLAHLPITLQFSSGCLWCHIFFEPKCIIVLNTFCKKVCLQITILKSQTTKIWWSYPVLQEGIGPWQLEAHRPRSAMITPKNSLVVRAWFSTLHPVLPTTF